VFEKRVLTRTYWPKKDEIIGGRRKVYNELHNVYSLPNIIGMINSRRMRLVRHVARMGPKRNAYRVLV
jgi:hypothetical protein